MSVLCLNVCRLCVPNIMSLGICFIKKLHLVKVAAFAWYSVKKFALFSASSLKDEQLNDKKANLHENWNMQTLFYNILNIFLILHQCWWLDAELTISLHAWRSSVSRSNCPSVQFVASSMSLIQLLAGLPPGLLPWIHPWITVFSRHSPGCRIMCPK